MQDIVVKVMRKRGKWIICVSFFNTNTSVRLLVKYSCELAFENPTISVYWPEKEGP